MMDSGPFSLRIFFLALFCGTTLCLLGGCGSGGTPITAPANVCVKPGAATAQVPILFTSDAALGVLDGLYVAVNSISLTDSCGNSVTAYTPQLQNTVAGVSEIELTHVNGVSEPLTVATIPQADYTAATITYSEVGVGFIYPDNLHFNLSIVQLNPIAATADVASPINIDGTGTALTLDTLLASPLVLGTTALGNPTYIATPAFALTSFKPVDEPTNDRNGKVNLRGLVNSVGSGTLNMNNSTTDSFNIETSPPTVFQGITSLSQLPPNAPASVDVALQADGSFRATRIEVENTATVGSWVGPFVATYQAGAYSEIIPILWQQSNPAFPNLVSDVYPWTFQFTSSTNFQRSGSAIDLNDLPFTPSFASFADVALGQGLSIDWTTEQFFASQPLTMAITASLVPRTFSATITEIAPATGYTVYSLTLAPNDSMQIIGGTTSLTAYTNAGTQLEDGPLSVGEQVNIHGLVFSDHGTLRLVADQVRLQKTPN